MAMHLLTVEKSKDDIEKLNQLLKDKSVLIEESQIVRCRLARGKSKLQMGLISPNSRNPDLVFMHMNQHIKDALDTKAEAFIDSVYDLAITNIEQEIERISEEIMCSLIKANK